MVPGCALREKALQRQIAKDQFVSSKKRMSAIGLQLNRGYTGRVPLLMFTKRFALGFGCR